MNKETILAAQEIAISMFAVEMMGSVQWETIKAAKEIALNKLRNAA